MSLFSPETIRINAESIGLSNISDDVLSLLSQDTEYRVREIIQEGSKFMRNARRLKLTTEDISYVLRLKHVDPIYGYDANEPLSFKQVQSTAGVSGGFIYYLPTIGDKEWDFDSVLSAPLPKVPPPIHFTCHWLAIEGVQPLIPENPSVMEEETMTSPLGLDESSKKTAELNLPGTKYGVKHHLSKEHQMYFETVTNILLSADTTAIQTTLSSLRLDAGIQQLLPYFVQFIAELVMKHLKEARKCALALKILSALIHNSHLFIEPYLHQLMPTLLTLIVGKKIGMNEDMDETMNEDYEEWNHWKLREDASTLIIYISARYGQLYPTLQPRIIKTLLKALLLSSSPSSLPHSLPSEEDKTCPDPQKKSSTAQLGSGPPHWPSLYGALVTLRGMGNEVLELFLLPNVRSIYEWIAKPIECEGAISLQAMQKEEEGQEKCLYALLVAIGQLVKFRWSESSLLVRDDRGLREKEEEVQEEQGEDEKMNMEKDVGEDDESEMTFFLRDKYADAYDCFGEQLIPFMASPQSVHAMI